MGNLVLGRDEIHIPSILSGGCTCRVSQQRTLAGGLRQFSVIQSAAVTGERGVERRCHFSLEISSLTTVLLQLQIWEGHCLRI